MFPDITKIMKTADEQGKLSEIRHQEIKKQNESILSVLESILFAIESANAAVDVQTEAKNE